MLIAYLRVSTQRQGVSGLGMEAQRQAVEDYAARSNQPIIATFTEIESGAVKDRPQLAAALDLCRRKRATLLIARLDRLGRNLALVAQILDANVDVRAADMPEANRLLLQMLAVFAEHERRLIGERTRAALAAAKARGARLGAHGSVLAAEHRQKALEFALSIAHEVQACQAEGAETLTALAAALNAKGVRSKEGGRWHPANVGRLVSRLGADAQAHSLSPTPGGAGKVRQQSPSADLGGD